MYYKISRFGFFMLGAALFASFLEPVAIGVIGGVAFLAAIFMGVSSKKFPAVTTALFAVAFGMVLVGTFWVRNLLPLRKLEGRTAEMIGVVTELSSGKGNASYRLTTSAVKIDKAPQKVEISVSGYGDFGLEVGDRITGTVTFFSLSGENMAQKLANRSDRRFLYGYFEGTPTILEKDVSFAGKTVTRIREALSSLLDRYFSDWRAGFTKALLLGIRADLPDEVTGAFRRSGMSHILAISGLHFSILFGGFLHLVRKESRELWKNGLRTGTLILLIVGYMTLTGFGPSVRRAGIMLIFYLLTRWMLARVETMENLGAAIVLVLLFDPMAACDGGFLMSVLCTAGLILFERPLTIRLLRSVKKPRVRRFLFLPIQLFSVSFVASAAVLPVAVLCYGSVSMVAPFSNLLSGFLTGATLLFAFLTVLFGLFPLFSPVAKGCAFLAGVAENLLYRDAAFFAGLPLSYVELEKGWITIAILGTMTLLLLPFSERDRKKRNFRLAVILSAFLFLFGETAQAIFYRDTVKTTVTALREGTAVTCERNDSAILLAKGLSASDAYRLSAPVGKNTVILLDSGETSVEKDLCGHLKPEKARVTFPESAERTANARTDAKGVFRFGENASVRFGEDFAEIDTGDILILYIFGECDIIEIEPRFRRADLMILEGVSPEAFPALRCRDLVLREQGGFYSGTEEVLVLSEGELTFLSRGNTIKKGGNLS